MRAFCHLLISFDPVARFESGGGPPHSKTWRRHRCFRKRASVLECGGPAAAFGDEVAATETQLVCRSVSQGVVENTVPPVHYLSGRHEKKHVTRHIYNSVSLWDDR